MYENTALCSVLTLLALVPLAASPAVRSTAPSSRSTGWTNARGLPGGTSLGQQAVPFAPVCYFPFLFLFLPSPRSLPGLHPSVSWKVSTRTLRLLHSHTRAHWPPTRSRAPARRPCLGALPTVERVAAVHPCRCSSDCEGAKCAGARTRRSGDECPSCHCGWEKTDFSTRSPRLSLSLSRLFRRSLRSLSVRSFFFRSLFA